MNGIVVSCRERWENTGNLFITGLFDYFNQCVPGLGSQTVFDIAREEMTMYRHYLREINGRPNWGWLRNMYHGLFRQLVRQDVDYYMETLVSSHTNIYKLL